MVDEHGLETPVKALGLLEILAIPGAKDIMLAFFCYCAVETTAGLWASSYMVLYLDVAEEVAATYASMFYIGITVGRFVSGFMTMRFSDKQMIRMGFVVMLAGMAVLMLSLPAGYVWAEYVALAGFVLIGIGCAPIFPCIIHSTPEIFGEDKSQAIVGVQMASAYMGSLVAPPLFGLMANHISAGVLPEFLLVILVVMIVMYERLVRKH